MGTSIMLQKKLQELESELTDIFRLPLNQTDSDHEIKFDDIKQRFIFLDKLLSAEVESQPQLSDDQFHEIKQRLDKLKTAFCDWNEFRICAIDDTLSICSDCNHVLLHDDVVESAATEAEDFCGEKSLEKVEESDVDFCGEKSPEKVEESELADKRIPSKMGKYCGVFGCGVIVGVISMVMAKLFCYSDDLIKYQVFVPPT